MVLALWDRFMVSGWKVVHSVGLALLYSVQDKMLSLDVEHLLRFLKEFVAGTQLTTQELFASAATFRVTNRMLAELERFQEQRPKLFVVKDLDSGELHWQLSPSDPMDEYEAFDTVVPNLSRTCTPREEEPRRIDEQTVLPFLLHNLDTGQKSVMVDALEEARAQQNAKATQAAPAETFWSRVVRGGGGGLLRSTSNASMFSP